MWRRYSRMVRQPYQADRADALEEFRSQGPEQREDPDITGAAPSADSDDRDAGDKPITSP